MTARLMVTIALLLAAQAPVAGTRCICAGRAPVIGYNLDRLGANPGRHHTGLLEGEKSAGDERPKDVEPVDPFDNKVLKRWAKPLVEGLARVSASSNLTEEDIQSFLKLAPTFHAEGYSKITAHKEEKPEPGPKKAPDGTGHDKPEAAADATPRAQRELDCLLKSEDVKTWAKQHEVDSEKWIRKALRIRAYCHARLLRTTFDLDTLRAESAALEAMKDHVPAEVLADQLAELAGKIEASPLILKYVDQETPKFDSAPETALLEKHRAELEKALGSYFWPPAFLDKQEKVKKEKAEGDKSGDSK